MLLSQSMTSAALFSPSTVSLSFPPERQCSADEGREGAGSERNHGFDRTAVRMHEPGADSCCESGREKERPAQRNAPADGSKFERLAKRRAEGGEVGVHGAGRITARG